jgi:23S rRNA pseudouridine1911/1915/1917 synthase
MRLDIASAQALNISREKAKKMILSGNVLVNGIVQTVPKFEIQDQEITSTELNTSIVQNEIKPNYDIPLDIIFEDDDILIVNKQKGLMVHEGASENFHTLANALVAKYGIDFQKVGSYFRPGIVHRLDKNTTGLMIVAKNQKSYNLLTKMIASREVTRKYLAVCYGIPRLKAGKITVNIGVDLDNKTKRKALQIGGREAVTHYKLLDSKNGFSLIECKLETGRTHQIRVHLSHIGHPIAGDETYCTRPKVQGFSSQILHAYCLEFNHPISNEPLSFINKEGFLNHIESFGFIW